MKTTALIMAGGRGERFWPMSRKRMPKQFLSLTGTDKSMIQSTVERILPLVNMEDILIATNREYKDLIREQLPDLPEENILCEPMAKNTAPCIGWGAVTARKRYGDAMMIVLPSDHLVQQRALFRGVLKSAMRTAEETGGLVTLGISPKTPDTGYGYIQYDTEEDTGFDSVFKVKRFVEKPNLETAKEYLASGEYLWNSGMFIWKASTILKEMEEKLPGNYELLQKIEEAAGTEREEEAVEGAFALMESISIDYGIMEKAKNVYVLPSSFGWDDVGSWLAVGRINPGNDAGNVIKGDVVSVNSARCIVQGHEKLVAMVGMEDTIVVDTPDALLICAKDSAGDIKKVLEVLKAVNREELL